MNRWRLGPSRLGYGTRAVDRAAFYTAAGRLNNGSGPHGTGLEHGVDIDLELLERLEEEVYPLFPRGPCGLGLSRLHAIQGLAGLAEAGPRPQGDAAVRAVEEAG